MVKFVHVSSFFFLFGSLEAAILEKLSEFHDPIFKVPSIVSAFLPTTFPSSGSCARQKQYTITKVSDLLTHLEDLECLFAAAESPTTVGLGNHYETFLRTANPALVAPFGCPIYKGNYVVEAQCDNRNIFLGTLNLGGVDVGTAEWKIGPLPGSPASGEYDNGKLNIVMDFRGDMKEICPIENLERLFKVKGFLPFKNPIPPINGFVDIARVVGRDERDGGAIFLCKAMAADPDRGFGTVLFYALKNFDMNVNPTFRSGTPIVVPEDFTYSHQGFEAPLITTLDLAKSYSHEALKDLISNSFIAPFVYKAFGLLESIEHLPFMVPGGQSVITKELDKEIGILKGVLSGNPLGALGGNPLGVLSGNPLGQESINHSSGIGIAGGLTGMMGNAIMRSGSILGGKSMMGESGIIRTTLPLISSLMGNSPMMTQPVDELDEMMTLMRAFDSNESQDEAMLSQLYEWMSEGDGFGTFRRRLTESPLLSSPEYALQLNHQYSELLSNFMGQLRQQYSNLVPPFLSSPSSSSSSLPQMESYSNSQREDPIGSSPMQPSILRIPNFVQRGVNTVAGVLPLHKIEQVVDTSKLWDSLQPAKVVGTLLANILPFNMVRTEDTPAVGSLLRRTI